MNFGAISAVFRWKPACWIKVSGSDANVFLQGQFTNDLRILSSSPAVYGLWLSVKGKVIADSFVVRDTAEDSYWVGSYFSPGQIVRERLESHIIADEVTIEDQTERWSGLTLFGATPPVGSDVAGETAARRSFIFPGRRQAGDHLEWVFPSEELENILRQVSGPPELRPEEVAALRTRAGIPAIPADIGPGDLPNEGGLESSAISYTKGCYLGQEVMARLKSMGQVRRRLVRIKGDAAKPVPSLPAPLFAGAKQVGELRSAAVGPNGDLLGLAMVSLLHIQPATKLAFAIDSEPVINLLDQP